MAIVQIGNYYAEWDPSCVPDKPGVGRIVLRAAAKLTELYWVSNLNVDDFRNMLLMLQNEKPVFWDTNAECLRTAHPQTHDAEPVGEQEGH